MNSESDYSHSLDADFPATRSTFLTVLCILTFVVSGYYFFSGIFDLFRDPSMFAASWNEASASMADAMDGADASTRAFLESFMSALGSTMLNAMKNATALALVQMGVALLSAFGAYLMFKMRRQGFNIYILAKIIGILGGLFLLGFNVLTIVIYVFIAVVGGVMIALYGTQRKYMH